MSDVSWVNQMLGYYERCNCLKTHELVLNRIAVINQIHGCAYGHGVGYPCCVRSGLGGWYVCTYGGAVVCRWRDCDLSVDDAMRRLEALSDALWLVARAGYLRRVHFV